MPATLKDFQSPADFLGAVRHAEFDLGFRDDVMQTYAADSHNGTVNSAGGFLVPEEWVPELLSLGADNPILDQVREIDLTSRVAHVPARFDEDRSDTESGGLGIAIKPEGDQFNVSRMKFNQVNLRARTHGVAVYVTEDLSGSATPEFMQILADAFDEELSHHLMGHFINGSGVGEPLGVIKSQCLIEVDQESMQTADTIVYANVVNMLKRIWRPDTAVWLANHECYGQLLSLLDAQNNRVWNGDLANFLGRPIVFTEHAQALGDKGDLLLGNWSEYIVGIRRRPTSRSSVHVRFLENQNAFKFWLELDAAPWWYSAITPKHGTSTLSPFVCLAPRAG